MQHFKVNDNAIGHFLKKVAKVSACADEVHKQAMRMEREVKGLKELDPKLSLVVTDYVNDHMINNLNKMNSLATQAVDMYKKLVTPLSDGKVVPDTQVSVEDVYARMLTAWKGVKHGVDFCYAVSAPTKLMDKVHSMEEFIRELPNMGFSEGLKIILDDRIADIDIILKNLDWSTKYRHIYDHAMVLREMFAKYQEFCIDDDGEKERDVFSVRNGYAENQCKRNIDSINKTIDEMIRFMNDLSTESNRAHRRLDKLEQDSKECENLWGAEIRVNKAFGEELKVLGDRVKDLSSDIEKGDRKVENYVNETAVSLLTSMLGMMEGALECDKDAYADLDKKFKLIQEALKCGSEVHQKLNEKIDCVVSEVERLSKKNKSETKKTIKVKGAKDE